MNATSTFYRTTFENGVNILIYCTTDCIILYKYLTIIIIFFLKLRFDI